MGLPPATLREARPRVRRSMASQHPLKRLIWLNKNKKEQQQKTLIRLMATFFFCLKFFYFSSSIFSLLFNVFFYLKIRAFHKSHECYLQNKRITKACICLIKKRKKSKTMVFPKKKKKKKKK